MKVFVINSGSSSIKFQLIDTQTRNYIIKGIVERIGEHDSLIRWSLKEGGSYRIEQKIENHKHALDEVFKILLDKEKGAISSLDEIDAVGHRVVHGGEKFKSSVLIDKDVLNSIKEYSILAPLHNPANITGIEAAMELLPNVPQVAVFDTSFHANMPRRAYLYALPYEFYSEKKIRRYGFHGTSHKYITERAIELLGLDINNSKLITCHLGNGASITAVKNGYSVDTSMGLTPLEGLVMGTRSGDMDPAITLFLMETYGYKPEELDKIYNKKSGLLGLSGISNDMRDIMEEMEKGNERAKIAYEVFIYRVKKYIGAYLAVLNGADAIIFTAGIGENNAHIREDICRNLEFFGIKIDKEKNEQANGKEVIISTDDSKVKVLVIPTNEELKIALETENIVENR